MRGKVGREAGGVLVVASIALGVGLAGCGESSQRSDATGVAREAVFTNGDFEANAIGAVPTGWTVEHYLDPGITDTVSVPPNATSVPQTLASLNLRGTGSEANGTNGILGTLIVGGATESVADPDALMATASLKYPKYGTRAARLNYNPTGSPATAGASNNVNALRQTMTVTNGDVDAADNKVHIRFAIAPVLQNPNHGYTQQPYYFVRLQNITKGTTLYSDFNTSAQPGVPWKIVGTVAAGNAIYYTDWQLVDIGPGNAKLAVGDQVELLVIASGCAAGGHWGRVYVDGIGSTIPGIYTSATGPAAANAGANVTYVVSYKNGGTGTAIATQLKMVIPTNTTYQSNSLPSACSGLSAGATGTLTCTLGDLAPGASGSFTVTLNINAGVAAGSTITNGNYYIQATGVTALLGPKVFTSVTSGVTYADVSVTKTDGVAAVGFGQAVTYTIVAANAGPGNASTVTIADTMPAQLTGVTWTCAATGGGSCPASGSGNLSGTTSLPVGATATYTVAANIIAGSGTGTVTNTATATLSGAVDPDPTNNSAVDTDSIGVLRTLSLSKTNANGGSVITVPASISCGTSCTSATGSFVNGTSVVLTASPVSGASFVSWGGACTGTSPTCTVTLNSDLTVTAAFTPPPTVNLTSGNNQGAALGAAFGTPLQVQVLDNTGTPIAGATVLFSVPSSGASAVLSATTATTNASGFASITATANGTAGAYSVVAALSGTPTTGAFSLWNYGAAATIAVLSGSGQAATVATAFAAPLRAIVRDAANQPVPNVAVTFTAPGSGPTASLSVAAANTDGSGIASVSATAGTVVGSYSVSAAVNLLVTPAASFALTNGVGAAASLTASSGGGQLTLVGTPFTNPLQVTVVDAFGNPVPGAAVTFSPPGAGASATLATASGSTDASGQLATVATANGTVGNYSVSASVNGVAAPVTFALANFGLLVISPATVTVAPLGAVTFSASGDPSATYAYTLASGPSGGQVGTFTGAYQAGATGSVTDAVTVTDSLGRTSVATVTVGPSVTISPATLGVAPRESQTFAATGGSGSGFTYVLSTNASGGNVVAGTGVYTAGATGSVTDVITVTDSLGNTATASLTVGPVVSISPSPTSVAPRGSRTFTATGGSGTGYVYALAPNPSGGSIDPLTGAYTAGATGSVTDVVTVTDSLGNTATSSIAVNAGVNLSPLLPSTAPRGVVNFTASDGSGTGYVYAVTSNNSGATIDATGKYTAGLAGSVTDTVTVTDSLGNTATTSVTVGPGLTLTGSGATSPPRGTVTFAATGGSGNGYVFSFGTNASGGAIDPASGAYTAGSTDSVTDTVVVTDALGNVTSANVVVGVGVSITPASPALPPRAQLNLVASGGSGAGFAFAIVTNASGAVIDPTTGRFTAGGAGGTVDVVRATDSLGNTATVAISVGNGLTINPSSPAVSPRQSQLFTAVGGSGAGLMFAITSNGSAGTIDASSGAYVAGIGGGATGATDVVTVTDSLGNSASATVHVGRGLTVTPATPTLAPLGTRTFSVSGGSGNGYTFVLATNLSGGSIDPSTGVYVAGAAGAVADVVRVNDSLGNTASVTVTVTAALVVAQTTLAAPPRGSLALAVTGGAGGNTFALATNGSGATVDPLTGAYVAGATGATSDLVTVTDANGAVIGIRINVGPALSLTPTTPAAPPRGALTFTASDGSGSGFHFSIDTNLSGGTIDADSGAYLAGGTSNVVDVVKVVDSLGNSATVSVSVGGGLAINPAAPQLAPRAAVTFSAAGGSGTGFMFALTANHSGGSIVAATGAYRAGATANVADQVTVTDSLGNTATATISIGPGVLVVPASSSTAPGGAVSLSASGGSGTGYLFTFGSNHSGGTVDGSTGLYTAGSTDSVTDTVTVTDSLGNTATATVDVGAGLAIRAPAMLVPPRGSLSLTATGGSGNYTFTLRANGSDGDVVSTTGRYTAGSLPGTTDVVEVNDDLGNRASLRITVGPGVSITPESPRAAPGGSLAFAAQGGSGTGFRFALTTNGSGGTIDPASGAYLAGDTDDSTDVVSVTDSLGNTDSVSVVVGNRVGLNPPVSVVAPRATVQFIASGGSGTGYLFSFVTNSSGATIDATTGVYQAGAIPNVSDIVGVVDSLGKGATAEVMVGSDVTLATTTETLAPMGVLTLNVSGGSGAGYQFVLTTNGSGGSVDPVTGNYQAGPTGDTTDVVTVTDSLGNSVTVTITVGKVLALAAADGAVPPRGSLTLAPSGGAMPYRFAFAANASGGSIDSWTGQYVAGATPIVKDMVKVTDDNDVVVSLSITVGPGVSITPAAPRVAAGGTVQLTAAGGVGSGYSWRIADGSARGSVDPGTGLYTASQTSPTGTADIVEARDPLGNTARVTIDRKVATVSASGGSSGCSCDTTSASPWGSRALVLAAFGLVVLTLRRRRRIRPR